MNSFLLNRQLGSISHQALATAQNDRQLRSLQAAPDIQFVRERPAVDEDQDGAQRYPRVAVAAKPHAAGVSSIAIDRFEGRYLLSAGADSSVAIWDLESAPPSADGKTLHAPLTHVPRTSTTESLGITHTTFYPFDSLAFLTTGYDHTLKLFSSETLQPSATFDLGSIVYSHATSPIASHLLVACASQHPAVRLVDLRSGSSTHSLAGHSGAVLSVAWHPSEENILVSGATDGCIRTWDVRRSASSLGVLDMDDSIGVAGYDGKGTGARQRERGRAHNGVVNGIVWSEDGRYLVSTGHDERMRVWDMVAGANTLANFGPALKNAQMTGLVPLLTPKHLTAAGKEMVFYPNPKEILSFDLHAGKLLSRLRVTTPQQHEGSTSTGTRNLIPRTTSLAWRAHHVEMFSAHADGEIRCWQPRTWEDRLKEDEDEESAEGEAEHERKRKREELEQIVRDLSGKRVTYS
ncbi:uncharacterized protein LTR77_002375 [Saxophila tyrrhenica]|uniref:DNA excision repair protein ERCC-8 n=1 Tax=Saxophila tyrrhenica TaxID=1690608 RepID=A0AAV9PJB0_9PEZI|nr:hypothetical protein LTR77_002375 [Saxophila tyrrhenica]